MHAMGIPVRSSIDRPRSFLDIWIVFRILFEDLDTGPRLAITTTAGCTSWHRAAGTAARIEAVGIACHRYRQLVVHHSIAPPGRRRARRAARQSVLPATATTVGRTSWHRAAGTAVHTENIEAAGTACHRYDSGSYIVSSRRGAAAGAAARTESIEAVGFCLSSLRKRIVHHGIAPPGRRRAGRTSR